jgi:urease accessory protein
MRTEAAQLRLLTWFSPAFPVGAFGWSHGLETAIAEGWVGDAGTLRDWIEALLEQGSGWTDAVLFRAAWAGEDVAELAEALAPSLERWRETMQLGAAFQKAVRPWMAPSVSALRADPPPPPAGELSPKATEGALAAAPYPVAAGRACGQAGIPLEPSLAAFLHAFAATLVSVAVRAIPLGQSEAVTTLAALEPLVLCVAARAAVSTLDDMGAFAPRSDIAAMRHETLQPRLFLS